MVAQMVQNSVYLLYVLRLNLFIYGLILFVLSHILHIFSPILFIFSLILFIFSQTFYIFRVILFHSVFFFVFSLTYRAGGHRDASAAMQQIEIIKLN